MEETFERNIAALDSVFSFVGRFSQAHSLDDSIEFSVTLAAEELFTNFVRHNVGGRERIAMRLDIENGCLSIRLTDFDVDPVDFTEEKPIDVRAPLAQRKVGGLGIHLIRSMFDSLTYEYRDRTMSVTAVKKLEGTHV